MARYLTRALFATSKQSVFSVISRSNTAAASSAVIPNSSSFLFRIRPLVAAASYYGRLAPSFSTRGFATRQTSSSLSDPNPNWSNRPPKETILLDGCDFDHWLIVMEKPEGDLTRDEIIDGYIKTLAMVVGSEEEARMKIYSVSTRHYFAFGALVTEEVSNKMKELPKVRWVLPDSYLDVRNKDYGGEPFINGQAVPYDPKYHEEWVRNNARANERNRRNDRPRNFDRSRNVDRRREGPPPNSPTGPGPIPPSNIGGQQNNAPNNPGNYPSRGPPNNAPNYQYGPGPNHGGPPPYQSGSGPNQNQNQSGFGPGVGPSQGQNQNAYANDPHPYQNQNVPGRDMPPSPNNFSQNRGFGPGQNPGNFAPPNTVGNNAGPNQSGFGPNMGPGPGQYQNSYAPNNQNGYGNTSPNQNGYGNTSPNQNGYGNTSPNQNVPGRDFPTRPNY